jgi:AbrB family looped-hinge helix DNA binding protein
MPIFESVVTRKGQITLPAEIRRKFNLREGDRVAFFVNDDVDPVIVVRPVPPVHERTYGVVERRENPIDLDVARQLFAESRVQAYKDLDHEAPHDERTL